MVTGDFEYGHVLLYTVPRIRDLNLKKKFTSLQHCIGTVVLIYLGSKGVHRFDQPYRYLPVLVPQEVMR